MRIASLVINHFINDNRVYKMAASLKNAKHEVVIVALHKDGLAQEEIFNGIPVHRIRPKALSLPDGNKLYGLIKYLSFSFLVVKHYRKFDSIHCNDFEAMLIGTLAKITRPRLKLVYDCHEYERERNGISRMYRFFVRLLEPIVIRFAAAVITVSEGIRLEYERLYHPKRLYLIMNVPHKMSPPHSTLLRKECEIRDDQKIFLYQGMLTVGRGIEMLLDVFSTMDNDRRVVVFMGNGKLAELVKEYESRYPNIRYHAAVPYEQIMTYTAGADFGLNTPQNVSLSYYYCLPNKLFEYIHAGIPIVTNNLFDCRKIVEEGKCGVVIEEFTHDGILQALDKIEAAPRAQMEENMKPLRNIYHWEHEEQKLFKLYKEIME